MDYQRGQQRPQQPFPGAFEDDGQDGFDDMQERGNYARPQQQAPQQQAPQQAFGNPSRDDNVSFDDMEGNDAAEQEVMEEPEPLETKSDDRTEAKSSEPVSVMDAAQESAQGTMGKVNSWFATKGPVMFGLFIVAVVCLLLGYFLYNYITNKLTQRNTALLAETQVPIPTLEYHNVNGGPIPAIGNGRRMSFTFWIYIHDLSRFRGMYRHVLHRGDKGMANASPLVFLDSDSNKLHIRFDSNKSATQNLTISEPFDVATVTAKTKTAGAKVPNADKVAFDLATHGMTIDYVPLQRWVHVAIVVNESVNHGSITAYLDAEVVKNVVSGTDIPFKDLQTVRTELQNLNLDRKGDVWIGGAPYEEAGPGFAGFVSRVQFFNYDLNGRDIYDVYMKGPVDSLSSKLGMPAYGVRSPIYRIGGDPSAA